MTYEQWRGPPSSFEMGTGMGNTHIYGTQWVQVWVIPVLSKSHGWRRGCTRNSVGGCWVGAARVLRGCSAGALQSNKKTVYWITYKSTARTPKFPMGATWVYSGCTVGVAMATMFLADFAWVGGGWVQCRMKNRGWEVGG